MNIIEINRNTIILILKNNINCGILVITILIEINSGLIFILLRGISKKAKIFNIYNRIGIGVGIRSGSIKGRISYSTSTEDRIKLTES